MHCLESASASAATSTLRLVVLIAFLVSVLAVVVATVFSIVRGVGLWRQARSTGAAFSTETAKFEERSVRTERLLAEADTSSQALRVALERLERDRAQLNVLLQAIERAKRRTRWLRVFLPVR
jgi:hypothetical protein